MQRTLDVSRSLFAFPASVLRSLDALKERMGNRALNLPDLMKLARDSAPDPAAFNGDPFLWPALITNNRVDAYYTRMAKTSLTQYAADAQEGRSFQNSHNTDELPIGRSLFGEMATQPGALDLGAEFGGGKDDLIEVVAAFYTARGLKLTNINTDDFIRGINLGLVSDVSIGFYNARYVCSICGLDLFDWDCPHIPGMAYNVTDTAGKVTGSRLAFAWIEDARLAEVSAVYKGATPGAAILKAQVEAEGGRIQPQERKTIESRYRCALPEKRLTIAVPGEGREGKTMADENRGAAAPPATNPPGAQPPATGAGDRTPTDAAEMAILTTLRQALGDTETASPDILKGFRSLSTVEGVRTLVALAADGRRYREDLITQAEAEGVRAYGAEGWAASKEHYGPILRSASTETIKRFMADWKASGDKRFAGGRESKPGEQPVEGEARSNAPVPSVLYT